LVIFGPGSLYTSILPNLLIRDIYDAVLKSDAYKVYVLNVMTQPGETDHYSAWRHLKVLIDHTDPRIVNACFVNQESIPTEMIEKYAEKGAQPVSYDSHDIRNKGYEVIEGNILKIDGQVRHDPERLARLIFDHYLNISKKINA